MTLDVSYRVEGQPGVFEITVEDTWTIGQLFDAVKRKYPNIKYAYSISESATMDFEDLLRDWVSDYPDFVFLFLNSETPPKELVGGDEPVGGGRSDSSDSDKEHSDDDDDEPSVIYPKVPTDDKKIPDWMTTNTRETIDIDSENVVDPEVSQPDHFLVYSTINYDSMTTPTEVTIPFKSTYTNVEKIIREKLDISPDLQIQIYLPTNIPFNPTIGPDNKENKIGNFFEKIVKVRHHLYVVVTRKIDEKILNEVVKEVCSVETYEMRLLISPICKSTRVGLCRMASLLGTFKYNGHKTAAFIKAVARCTGFAPLICGLCAIVNRQPITGKTLTAITSSLHSLFSRLLASITDPRRVLDRCLECACYVLRVPGADDQDLIVPPITVTGDTTDPLMKYMSMSIKKIPDVDDDDHNIQYFYQWNSDIGRHFDYVYLKKPKSQTIIQNIFHSFAAFRPVAPLSTRSLNVTAILQYIKGRTLLFLGESARAGDEEIINIIDPFKGSIQRANIEELAKSVAEGNEKELLNLIDPDQVEEVITVLFDGSGSMFNVNNENKMAIQKKYDYSKDPPIPVVGDTDRFTIAMQYFITFLSRSFGFRLPQIYSFISFNDEITVNSDFSTLLPNVEKSMSTITVHKSSRIWDAVDTAIEKLVEFNGDRKKYKNAKSRILIFSDGIDAGSTAGPHEVCQKAIDNKITIDSIIVTLTDSCLPLCKLCHLTGGLAFRPNDPNSGNAIFEMESFLSMRLRPDAIVEKEKITPKMFEEKKIAREKFDESVQNQEAITKTLRVNLTTPNFEMEKASRNLPGQSRHNLRLLRELKKIQINADKEKVKVFLNEENINDWKVYIKGPKNTNYSNHWWYLSVSFPEMYPLVPPLFRFITIPYHVNISEDGRVCAQFLSKTYQSNHTVLDLINKIRSLLKEPDKYMPIQLYKKMLSKDEPVKFRQMALDSCSNTEDSLDDLMKGAKIADKKDYKVKENDFEDDIEDFPSRPTIKVGDVVTDFDIKGSSMVVFDEDDYI